MSLAGFTDALRAWLEAGGPGGWDTELANIEQSVRQLWARVDELEALVDDQADPDAAARIRHDMRNALGAVSGYAGLMAEELEGQGSLDDTGRGCLHCEPRRRTDTERTSSVPNRTSGFSCSCFVVRR